MRAPFSAGCCAVGLLSLALNAFAAADVVINEVQASNGSTLLDEDEAHSDWIELLNRGTQTVSLAGWALSDDTGEPMKWTFPALALAPGARSVVFASGKDRTNAVQSAQIDSPLGVPGLVLWLKADGTSYTNGAKVAGWTDLSGSDNHAFSTNNMACPTFRTNAVNGHAAVRFTKSAAQSLLLPVTNFNGLASLRDVSVFVVCRWGGSATAGVLGAWDSAAGNTHFEVQSGGVIRMRIGALDSAAASARSTTGVTANAWCQLAAVMSGAGDAPALNLYRNGAGYLSYAKEPGAAALSSYAYMALGNSLKSDRFFDGDMAEVLLFNRALSAAERTQVGRYLADRYGLSYAVGAVELHANFSLDADGETLTLRGPDAQAVDAVEVPEVPLDAAYGRCPDGTGGFAYLAAPTPGAANAATAYAAPLGKPTFSRKRGICDGPFSLTLSHEEAGAAIWYTLDGSEPAPTNGVPYATAIPIASTTVVRAMAFKTNALPRRAIATHTYLFLDDVLGQTSAPPGWPTAWGSFTNVSYAVSAYVAAQPGYTNAMRAALLAAPAVSLALGAESLFGTNGVYANPLVDGFERVASAEWIANGASETQIDAALRVQGAASRDFNNSPKKSLRLLFRAELGESRLQKPVLSSGGTSLADFNTLVLRADYNNSWIHWDAAQRLRGISVHDQWVRDTQIALSGSGSHGNHVHLFVNGRYWGLYNAAERTDAAFAANYFGGRREDYDAMTQDGIRDGDNVAWNAMIAAARGDLATRAQYEALGQYLDVDHFIDYMIVNLYGSNEDWPVNNWSAVRKREAGAGYRFYCWDGERTLEATNANKTAISGTLTNAPNPASLYSALRTNAEFRLRFADRLHRHLFNAGALTPAAAAGRLQALTNAVDAAVFGEEARWGAYRSEIYDRGGPSPRYGYAHFTNECARLLKAYFPVRTGIVLKQFRAASLYPAVDAPELSQHGGTVEYGARLSVVSTQGVAYVTRDGSDPRVAFSGEVAPAASAYAGPFALTNACTVKARALTNGVWSALTEASFGVVLTEPVFLPAGDGDWGVATNWLGAVVPQGAGARVRIATPAADRSVSLRAPVTVGQIRFDHAGSAFRNRVRDRGTGNALTFDGGGSPACISVSGTGAGYAEFEVAAGVVLQSDLTVDVQSVEGSADYGALRLRESWTGPGGLRKTGPGVASLTGENKLFAGPVFVDEGVLAVTGPAAPAHATGVTVASGGQVRLSSASTPGEPRAYAFGGVLALSGFGRGAEISDGAGQGKLGALRYDPGTQSNVCVLTTPVALQGEADLHVDGSLNRLDLAGGVSGGSRLVKSGGGTLTLPAGVALTAAVEVANGTLAFAGSAAVGPLAGAGAVRVDGRVIAAPSVGGVALDAVLRQAGADAVSNGVLRVAQAPETLGRLRLYLPNAGDTFRGALFAPLGSDLAGLLRRVSCEVFVPDAAGAHAFDGAQWSLRADAQVVTVPASADFGAGAVLGRVVEVRLGAAPSSFAAWQSAAFTNASDRANSAVSGPLAAPLGDGVPNLARYAFGLGLSSPASARYPHVLLTAEGAGYRLPFDPGRDDVAYIVEAAEDLEDWRAAELLFDSRADYPEAFEDGWLTLRDAPRAPRRFYRLRLLLQGAE